MDERGNGDGKEGFSAEANCSTAMLISYLRNNVANSYLILQFKSPLRSGRGVMPPFTLTTIAVF